MNQRKELERLCRYITRSAIANERLALYNAGQVVLILKTPYRDGTTHMAMSPLEFMQRIVVLVPRPRLNLIRSHGVLARYAKLRSKIIPGEKKSKSCSSGASDDAQYPQLLYASVGRAC